jgi:predicted nucleotidyltransferase
MNYNWIKWIWTSRTGKRIIADNRHYIIKINIIKSFFSKDELNSKIWDENQNLRSEVREKLLQTANEFVDFIGVPLLIEDVIFTGSLANYNWSEYSDIDLHVVCDFIQFSDTELSLYEELFKVKKTIFNTNHDIKIFGYEVELYVQNATEAHFSSGVYSVLYDKWDVKPEKEDSNIDTKILKSKINHWKTQIDTVVDNATEKDIDEAREYIKKFKEKLKKYRSSGLKKEGEYSYENLVFKYLRRSDYLEKLFNLENNLLDKELSLTEQKLDFLLNLKKS